MSIDRVDSIDEHPNFFRNNYRRLFTVSFVLISIIFLLIALVFYQHYTRPIIKYFVTTSDGRLIEIYPS